MYAILSTPGVSVDVERLLARTGPSGTVEVRVRAEILEWGDHPRVDTIR